ncbi:hypothetical protein KCP75_20925 [Salmonella enterica subsp. enterica]|nr:hypothetical protein KCP75_20925 [Salmonella enterica subsp. enterica]
MFLFIFNHLSRTCCYYGLLAISLCFIFVANSATNNLLIYNHFYKVSCSAPAGRHALKPRQRRGDDNRVNFYVFNACACF